MYDEIDELFQAEARNFGFVFRPAREGDEASLTAIVDRIFGVPRRQIAWSCGGGAGSSGGARWHQHWTVHVVRLRAGGVHRNDDNDCRMGPYVRT